MQLILGSGSPRRREILHKMGYAFDIMTAEVVESQDSSLGLAGLSEFNARLKAEAVYAQLGREEVVVIGSDTVVWLDKRAYGKPTSSSHAVEMLSELSGQTHQVGTAVAIVTAEGTHSYCEIAEVTFHELTSDAITAYIQDVPVMDKAGSYAIQHGGERIVKHYEGEFECIMGLPTVELDRQLTTLGVSKL